VIGVVRVFMWIFLTKNIIQADEYW